MRVLLVGSGGREHALGWALRRSDLVTDLIAAPGNPGIAKLAECVAVPVTDLEGLLDLALNRKVGMVVVGPEVPLVAGIADLLTENGVTVFGPSKRASLIEGSKAFAKRLMVNAGVPTAAAAEFEDPREAVAYTTKLDGRVVVKADGLAAGKGVAVCETTAEAADAIRQAMQERRFGDAGARVLIEERLEGPEFSVLAFCDGKTVLPMAAAQDFKRAYESDAGPNTGGMGSYSPVPAFTQELADTTLDRIFEPVIETLSRSGDPYVGVLYAGLMLTPAGLKVIEFNCRFGDPETQALLPRARFDLCEAMLASTDGSLAGIELEWSDHSSVCVVAASEGYPEADVIPAGFEINGIEAAESAGAFVFHAGTDLKEGKLVTKGGRVLSVTGMGTDLTAARRSAYESLKKISFQGMRFRSDIARSASLGN